MRTDDLIGVLSTNVEQVKPRVVVRMLGMAMALSALLVLVVVAIVLGVRPDLTKSGALEYVSLKLLFTMIVLVPASLVLLRLVRPGGERRLPLSALALPFIAVAVLAAGTLALTPSKHWSDVVLGDQWLECLLSIPVIAVVPFAAIVWVVRRMAPTDLTRAGALSGLVAGTISALGYAFHCTDDSLPFIAIWYGGTIAICTIAGAKLGPKLLRW